MKYRYWMTQIAGIGNVKTHRLLSYAGSAKEVYDMPEAEFRYIEGMRREDVAQIVKSRAMWDLDGAYEQFVKSKISMITVEQEEYPRRLRHISLPPYAIFYRGSLPEESKKSIAIVGARNCTEYGRFYAGRLAALAARAGIAVISGMALGVDAAAHAGAMQYDGKTYAVLGCGVDYCYPKSNRNLYEYMMTHGGVLSEYIPGTRPVGRLFPQRNRIISALSDVVVIVEAGERSGSLITADFALEQGKDIYAVPGRISDGLSAGCNRLIKQGAGILVSIEDFLQDLQIAGSFEGQPENFSKKVLEKEERLVYSVVDLQPKNVEQILEETNLTIGRLCDILLRLENLGAVKEIYKNYYIRIC